MVRSRIALLALGTVLLMAANASAGARVFVHIGIGAPAPIFVAAPPPLPPAPVIMAAPPAAPYYAYGYVWRPAYYAWNGYGYQLVPGAWVRPPFAGAVWVSPRWVARPRGYGYGHGGFWVNGYWRH